MSRKDKQIAKFCLDPVSPGEENWASKEHELNQIARLVVWTSK